jgi:hypothetical protein
MLKVSMPSQEGREREFHLYLFMNFQTIHFPKLKDIG